jgi:hypothetical protein
MSIKGKSTFAEHKFPELAAKIGFFWVHKRRLTLGTPSVGGAKKADLQPKIGKF